MIFFWGFAWIFLFILLPTRSLCALVNVSIDDTLGDERNGNMITYSDGWKLGQNCSDCTATVDATQAFEHTWHDSTYSPVSIGGDGEIRTASVSFNGTAVYVFCILTRSDTSPDGNTDMIFFLDQNQVGNLEQTPTGNTTYLYNQVVFSTMGLVSGTHNIRIEVGHNGTKALILLDRIVYTTDISDSSSTSTSMQLAPLTITELSSSPVPTTTSTSSSPPSILVTTFFPILISFLLANVAVYILGYA